MLLIFFKHSVSRVIIAISIRKVQLDYTLFYAPFFSGVIKNGVTEFKMMSQEYLADKIGTSRNTISAIETGKKAQLHDEDNLQKLADAFELTSTERKEFFLAASGIQPTAYARDDKHFLLDDLINDMEDMPTPAFINDCFGDIVAGNAFMINFLSISKEYLDPESLSPSSFNVMNIVCSEDSGYKRIAGRYWERSVIRNMLYFRRISLRYRYTAPFPEILNGLLSNKHFQYYWMNPMHRDDGDADYEYYAYRHPDFGVFMKYISTISAFVTNYGELYLVNYIPVDKQTTEIFQQSMETVKQKSTVNNWEKFGKWPKSF